MSISQCHSASFSLQKSLHHFSSLYKEQSLELSTLVVESYSFILILLDSLLTGILNIVSRLNIELHFILPHSSLKYK